MEGRGESRRKKPIQITNKTKCRLSFAVRRHSRPWCSPSPSPWPTTRCPQAGRRVSETRNSLVTAHRRRYINVVCSCTGTLPGDSVKNIAVILLAAESEEKVSKKSRRFIQLIFTLCSTVSHSLPRRHAGDWYTSVTDHLAFRWH